VKFREHRGGFDESMATVVEVADRAALLEHMRKLLQSYPSAPPVTDETVDIVSYYGIDQRNGWDTYIVILKDYGPFGFTDSPAEKAP